MANTFKFSERWMIDGVFKAHCRSKGLDYCVLNFLSWLESDDIVAKKVMERLKGVSSDEIT